jgi:AcrR family transcriptional regulator
LLVETDSGRSNQKQRTRKAIVEACRDLIRTGHEISMPDVARVAMVSEATAYRYFPDLVSLISEAYVGLWGTAEEALAPVAMLPDPVARVAFATDYLLRIVLSYQGAARAMIAATITHPERSAKRPGIRFGLIDLALAPLDEAASTFPRETLAQLKRDLAVVMSAEALFTLTDLAGLTADEAIASAVHTAATLTRAAISLD